MTGIRRRIRRLGVVSGLIVPYALRRRLRAATATATTSAAVYAVWKEHPDLTAKQIIRALPPEFQWASVRGVQEILKGLRGQPGTRTP